MKTLKLLGLVFLSSLKKEAEVISFYSRQSLLKTGVFSERLDFEEIPEILCAGKYFAMKKNTFSKHFNASYNLNQCNRTSHENFDCLLYATLEAYKNTANLITGYVS